jgi:hypothetical protein
MNTILIFSKRPIARNRATGIDSPSVVRARRWQTWRAAEGGVDGRRLDDQYRRGRADNPETQDPPNRVLATVS